MSILFTVDDDDGFEKPSTGAIFAEGWTKNKKKIRPIVVVTSFHGVSTALSD